MKNVAWLIVLLAIFQLPILAIGAQHPDPLDRDICKRLAQQRGETDWVRQCLLSSNPVPADLGDADYLGLCLELKKGDPFACGTMNRCLAKEAPGRGRVPPETYRACVERDAETWKTHLETEIERARHHQDMPDYESMRIRDQRIKLRFETDCNVVKVRGDGPIRFANCIRHGYQERYVNLRDFLDTLDGS